MRLPVFFALSISLSGLAGVASQKDARATETNVPSAISSADSRKPADGIVPLFYDRTVLEPDTIVDTPEALITRVGDRVRDRHAREGMFHAYDHYLGHYFENRTVSIEIIDRVAKGGDSITYNMTSLYPLNKPNLRLFFEGKGTVAQYMNNSISKEIDPLHYTLTIKSNQAEKRPLKIGDRIEMEFSPFLVKSVDGKQTVGRTNYYGTALLYVVGKGGMQPWEGKGANHDSYPMPADALLGGTLTNHRQYSDEPKELFKQIGTNISPASVQNFMLGRRLHHTDFGDGKHSEPGNPVYEEVAGKLGEHFTNKSCAACHVNNGRALPAKVGAPMTQYLVAVSGDAKGSPHPKLGHALQSQSKAGAPEGGVTIAEWKVTQGTYGDGTAYSLQQPVYRFAGVVPEFYSVRIAPPLVGMGLLEAIDEADVLALGKDADPAYKGRWGHERVVNDPTDGQARLGRFGWKAGQSRLRDQIANALKNDMGVATSVYPSLDIGAGQTPPGTVAKLGDTDLDHMYRYMAVLGIPPRRDLDDADASAGEKRFTQIGCAKCHTPTLKTGKYHPLAELRNQTIHPYTDLRLHDMGPGLADNMAEGNAGPADWRTAPLWGIGSTAGVSGGNESYLHDGRARTLEEAILWHGGEAEASKEAFRKMPAADRAALVKFLKSM